jgi:AraC-like DNA-binding protein
MNLLANAASLVIGIAATLVFYTALLHITRKKSGQSYKFRIIRDVLVGVQSLQLFFVSQGTQFEYPFLLYPFITLVFISGPLYYMRYYMFIYPGGRIPRGVVAQLVPAALVLAYETWFYFFSSGDRAEVLRGVFSHPLDQPVTIVLLIGLLILEVQYFLLVRLESGYIKSTQTRAPIQFSIVVTITYMIDTALIGTGFAMANSTVLNLGILLVGANGITYLIFENRYPYFYQLVAREEKQQKYKRSLIQGLSKEKIITRLQELMEEEKIYRQFELKLDTVAAMLLITPHQLSEFINDCVGVNFSNYVNNYRVEEAKELLVSDPDRSTLAIGLEVGFGSKPSFNTIFKQKTGLTPSEFRKKGLKL